jgi:hypothetical protein
MNGIEIESVGFDDDGNIVIIAVVEDMVYCESSRSLASPPEYGPARCRLVIFGEYLEEVTQEVLATFSEEKIKNFIDDYDISSDNWEVIEDDYDPSYD